MKLRKIVSLTALLASLLMMLTGIILYIAPQGRIAYWSDWRLWGLDKTDWGNIHINMGFLMLIVISLHIYYNWKPIVSYLKNRAKQIKVFTPDFSVALILTLVCALGTYLLVPPFNWVMEFNDHFKDTAAEKYGEPPYGHAELSSLKTFTKKVNLDLEKSIGMLNKAGYPIEDHSLTLIQIAQEYRITPKGIYSIIKSAVPPQNENNLNGVYSLPESLPPGTGNLTLVDLATQYNLNMEVIIRQLKIHGIESVGNQTIKAIAAGNEMGAIDIYEAIKEAAAATK